MKAKNILKWVAALFLVTGAVAIGPGCGASSGSLCNKICDCTGCSEQEMAECVDSADDARKAASDEGCDDQYNAYFSCVDGELTCTAGSIDADGCDSEADALGKCMKGKFVGIGGGAKDNVGACKDLYATLNGLDCIGDATLDDSACDAYKDTTCDISEYFDCLAAGYVCINGVLDATEASKCAVPTCN